MEFKKIMRGEADPFPNGTKVISLLEHEPGVIKKECNCTVREDLHYEVILDSDKLHAVVRNHRELKLL